MNGNEPDNRNLTVGQTSIEINQDVVSEPTSGKKATPVVVYKRPRRYPWPWPENIRLLAHLELQKRIEDDSFAQTIREEFKCSVRRWVCKKTGLSLSMLNRMFLTVEEAHKLKRKAIDYSEFAPALCSVLGIFEEYERSVVVALQNESRLNSLSSQ